MCSPVFRSLRTSWLNCYVLLNSVAPSVCLCQCNAYASLSSSAGRRYTHILLLPHSKSGLINSPTPKEISVPTLKQIVLIFHRLFILKVDCFKICPQEAWVSKPYWTFLDEKTRTCGRYKTLWTDGLAFGCSVIIIRKFRYKFCFVKNSYQKYWNYEGIEMPGAK